MWLERKTSRSVVKLSFDCDSGFDDTDISVVANGMLVSSNKGSSVGWIILLFFRCGISILLGFSFFELFKMVINFKGIVLFVKFFEGCFIVETDVFDAGMGVVAEVVVEEVLDFNSEEIEVVFSSSVNKMPYRLLKEWLFWIGFVAFELSLILLLLLLLLSLNSP